MDKIRILFDGTHRRRRLPHGLVVIEKIETILIDSSQSKRWTSPSGERRMQWARKYSALAKSGPPPMLDRPVPDLQVGWRMASLILSSGNLMAPDPSLSVFEYFNSPGVRTRSGLPYPQTPKFLVHRLPIKSLWIELATDPFQHLFVLSMIGVTDRLHEAG